MRAVSRREFIRHSSGAIAAAATAAWFPPGVRAEQHYRQAFEVIHPRGRVPLSFIVDDSTCLVNMAHFGMPQFAEAWPDSPSYKKPWHTWPREIPDSFVREFGEWCAERGVKGKYSVVPNPACVGWLDRGLPGWSASELEGSLQLVHDLMLPNWDIHPEMITHTRLIDIKTGRPTEGATAATMENWFPHSDVSVDELASYIAYALRILKKCDLPCEGITTPGGFGNGVESKLPVAVHQAVSEVFSAELPHYFKYVVDGDESTEPKLEFISGSQDVSELTMNIPAGTGDWFGGWDGDDVSQPHLYANADASSGRMVELVERGQPAIMLCHWPGIYTNGTKAGFTAFQQVVTALDERFSKQTQWMKLSEIGRYWAARKLTRVHIDESGSFAMEAPIACRDFTVRMETKLSGPPILKVNDVVQSLREVGTPESLEQNTFCINEDQIMACFDLPKGRSNLVFS